MADYQQGDVCSFCGSSLTQSKTSGKWYCKPCYIKKHGRNTGYNQSQSQPVQRNEREMKNHSLFRMLKI